VDLELVERIKELEGFRRYAYECSQGALTIGYGTVIERGGHGIPEFIAELLIRDYLQTLQARFETQGWFRSLDPDRQAAALEMGYQMGYEGVLGFSRMIEAIEHSEWDRVKAEALDSQWAKQTPARADLTSSRLAYGARAEQ